MHRMLFDIFFWIMRYALANCLSFEWSIQFRDLFTFALEYSHIHFWGAPATTRILRPRSIPAALDTLRENDDCYGCTWDGCWDPSGLPCHWLRWATLFSCWMSTSFISGQRILILVEYLGMGIDIHVHLAWVKFQLVALLSTLLNISAPNIVHLR